MSRYGVYPTAMASGVDLSRLDAALERAEMSDAAASLAAGLSKDFIRNIRRNEARNAKVAGLSALATALEVSVGYLLGETPGDDIQRPEVPVVGIVGAGATFFPIDDYPLGDGQEMVESPIGAPPGTLAVRVRGSSMVPVYEDGDLVYFAKHEPNPAELINRRCVVGTTDGRVLLKTLGYGSEPGLFTLTSYNAPAIIDVPIEWVARIMQVTPRP